MSLKKYILGIIVSTMFCWVAWILVLVTIDPQQAGALGFVSFYLSLFFAFVGTLTVFGFYGRLIFSPDDNMVAHIATAFRQALFGGIYVIGSLIFQALGLLNAWTSIIFFIFIFLLEFMFLARAKVRTHGQV